jgi:hypothetical protein
MLEDNAPASPARHRHIIEMREIRALGGAGLWHSCRSSASRKGAQHQRAGPLSGYGYPLGVTATV